MLKLTTRNNNTNAATTREIYPRIIRGISIDSPRTAIGHERVRLSRTKHEPPRQPKWMIYRARRENDTKWRGQSVLPSFSPIVSRKKKKRKKHRRIIRKLWSARFEDWKILSLVREKRSRVINRLAYFRLFVEGSTISDHVTTRPPLLIISRWQIKKHSILGPIIHRMSARC